MFIVVFRIASVNTFSASKTEMTIENIFSRGGNNAIYEARKINKH